jgi:hypothetical protein
MSRPCPNCICVGCGWEAAPELARAALSVERAVDGYQAHVAAEAVGYFLRGGRPGPSLFQQPAAAVRTAA